MKYDRRMNQTTIMEVALAAGVSLATVSRVTNHPDKVKQSTREKVEKVIRERGYVPNVNAKSLASSKSKTVAVVVPELTRSSIAGLVDGIADCSKRRDYMLRLFVNRPNSPTYISENDYWSNIMSTVVDGILYINDELTEENIKSIKNSLVPVVLTDTVVEDDTIPFVSIDYYRAAFDMTSEMIRRGNKKIWMISANKRYVNNELKINGYSDAMKKAGLTPNIKYVSGKIQKNEIEYAQLLSEERPDVAFVCRDSMAVSFINVACSMGIKIPDEIQVIGFQNTKYAELSRPTLTCIETPIYDLGERAMEILSKMMDTDENDEIDIQTKNYVDYSVVWRDSTKK